MDEENQILKALHETDLSMQANERLLAQYKQRLAHEYTQKDAALQKLRNEVDSLKVSVNQCDSRIHQISSNDYDVLLKKIEAIEQKVDVVEGYEEGCGIGGAGRGREGSNASGMMEEVKGELQELREETIQIITKQEELARELVNIKEISSSKSENLKILSRYFNANEELQKELIEQITEKDRLMADYGHILKNFQKLKEQYLELKIRNKQLMEDLGIYKAKNKSLEEFKHQWNREKFQKIMDENAQLRSKLSSSDKLTKLQLKRDQKKEEIIVKSEQSITHLKQELRNKESVMALLQKENESYHKIQSQLNKSCCKLEKMSCKYQEVKTQLNESMDNSNRIESELAALRASHCDEVNMQLQVLSSAIDGLLLILGHQDEQPVISMTSSSLYPSSGSPPQGQIPMIAFGKSSNDHALLLQLVLEKITYAGQNLSRVMLEKCSVEKQLLETKQQAKILKRKLKEFKEDLLLT